MLARTVGDLRSGEHAGYFLDPAATLKAAHLNRITGF